MRHLTIVEAAQALKLSVPTVKRYIYEGRLHSTKLPGGQHRIAESEIERLLGAEDPATGSGPVGLDDVPPEKRVEVLERWVEELQAEVDRLTATLEVMARYLTRLEDTDGGGGHASAPGRAPRVAVLGPGCRRCDSLYELTRRVLRAVGADLPVERVSDLDAIADYGPILTPALVIDDTLISSGRVPSEAALRGLLRKRLG
jgi:small redox-active disulfide protein 2